jgi:hypothetical protein
MILKIERYYGFVKDDPCGWWMLDDIRKISHYKHKDHPFSKDFVDVDADVFLLDYEDYLENTNAAQPHRDVIKLVCRLSNGDEFVVLFDTVGYILNDNGKTIEKLVANYR